jgi:hypothetical protein
VVGRSGGMSVKRRVSTLEEQAMSRRRVPEPMPRQSDARRYMREHVGLAARLRRGELGPEEAAEVEAFNAAFEARRRRIRGEGASYEHL